MCYLLNASNIYGKDIVSAQDTKDPRAKIKHYLNLLTRLANRVYQVNFN